MADTDETIADIVAEMRALSNPISDGIIAIKGRSIADRLEAAHKREIEATAAKCCQLGRLAGYGASEIKHQQEPVGNEAKMLEVMNRVHDYLGELIRDNLVEDTPRASDLADDVYDAIHGIHSTAEKSSAVGDAAKLREAVIGLRDRISMFYKNEWIPYDEWEGADDDASIALAAPPRNCDRYSAEDLKVIFKRELASELPIANEHEKNLITITAMRMIDTLFATATEKEGGNNGNE